MPIWGGLTYESPAIERLVRELDVVAAGTESILLLGERGSGKTSIAEAIHRVARGGRPFVTADCPTIPKELFEATLFGHEKGAFTGATSSHEGLFEVADGGTLFLDEIAEIPVAEQPKLLRAVERRTFRRVGAKIERTVDVRLIAATNRDLDQAVADGKFRDDLRDRIAVLPFTVPPLRARIEDVGPLAKTFYKSNPRVVAATSGFAEELSPEVVDALRAHDWPGNVRELRNVVGRLVLAGIGTGKIDVDDVRVQIAAGRKLAVPTPPPTLASAGVAAMTLAQEVDQLRRRRITEALVIHRTIAGAAKSLGMTRQALDQYVKANGGLDAFR